MLQKHIVHQNVQVEDCRKLPTIDIQWLFIFAPKQIGALLSKVVPQIFPVNFRQLTKFKDKTVPQWMATRKNPRPRVLDSGKGDPELGCFLITLHVYNIILVLLEKSCLFMSTMANYHSNCLGKLICHDFDICWKNFFFFDILFTTIHKKLLQ